MVLVNICIYLFFSLATNKKINSESSQCLPTCQQPIISGSAIKVSSLSETKARLVFNVEVLGIFILAPMTLKVTTVALE